MSRLSWKSYFLEKAFLTATRSTCKRRQVGVVLVRDHREISCGYNGARAGAAHCTDVGCLLVNGHCKRCIHAEANSIITAAKVGVKIEGCDAYLTDMPCWACFNMLIQTGVQHIYYHRNYQDPLSAEYHNHPSLQYLSRAKIIP